MFTKVTCLSSFPCQPALLSQNLAPFVTVGDSHQGGDFGPCPQRPGPVIELLAKQRAKTVGWFVLPVTLRV